MLDIKFIRENPDIVKENIKKKFQDEKLPLVDEVIELDSQRRANIQEADQLRSDRNRLSKQVGMLMGQAKKDPSKLAEAEAVKKQVTDEAERLAALEKLEAELDEKVHHIMLQIPQIIDPSVPIGPDDSANVEVQRFGAHLVSAPYHSAAPFQSLYWYAFPQFLHMYYNCRAHPSFLSNHLKLPLVLL